MYLRQVHTRAGIIWHVDDDKELWALSVPPFRRLSSLITVILSLFLCLLLKREVKYSQMETDQLTLGAWWMNTSCGGLNLSEKKRRTQRN